MADLLRDPSFAMTPGMLNKVFGMLLLNWNVAERGAGFVRFHRFGVQDVKRHDFHIRIYEDGNNGQIVMTLVDDEHPSGYGL